MKFLLDSLRKNRRRLKVEQLILLALRCLVVLMLAFAAARFTGCEAMEAMPFGHGETETAVFILDDSYSMGQRAGAGELYAAAAADIVEQIKSATPANVAIIRTSRPTPGEGLARLQPVTETQSVSNHLAGLRLADSRADLAGALEAARSLLANVAGTRRLYVLSDFRRGDVAEQGRADELRRRFSELREAGVRIVAADYGAGPQDNLTIQGVRLVAGEEGREGLVLARGAFSVRVSVRNNSPRVARQVAVALTGRLPGAADGKFHPVAAPLEIAEVAPGQSRACEFKVVIPRPGAAVLRAELPTDELAGDNAACLALNVRDAIHVLIVDDREGALPPEARESLFLQAALQPGGDTTAICRTKVVTSRDLTDEPLADHDLVVLANVAEFPVAPAAGGLAGEMDCPQLARLGAYVAAGGGLAIFTGDRVDTTFYNRFLYAGGKGLCPLPLAPRRGDPTQRAEFFRMAVSEAPEARNVRGQLLRFASVAGVDIMQYIRFYAFTPARAPAEASAGEAAERPIVLARFNDPDRSPAIVLRPFGRGNVLLYCTTANRRWTDWPAYGTDAFYVAAMNDMARFLARSQDPGLNGPVGQPFEMPVPDALRRARAVLSRLDVPGAAEHEWDPAGERLRWDDTARAGAYAVVFTRLEEPAGEVLFARNADADEGDLAVGGRDALDAVAGDDYVYVQRRGDGSPRALWTRPAREYWVWALVAMLVLMALETFLAQRFGHYSTTE